MSDIVPKGWKVVRLGQILSESRIPIGYDDPARRISVRLHLQGVHKRDERATDTVGSTTHFKRFHGQLIYGKQNLHNGAVGVIPKHLDGFGSSQDIPAFDIYDGFSVSWLFQYISRYEYYKGLEKIASGTGSKRIQPSSLFKERVLAPPLLEQQKIAAILSSVDDVIEKTRAQIDKLKDLKAGLMQELLTKGAGLDGAPHTAFKNSPVGQIPDDWEVVPLVDLCSKISVGIASSTTHAYAQKGVPILRNQNILECSIRATDMLHISQQFSDENASKKIREGDVLTVRTGYPGVSAIVPKEFDGCHSFTTLISRPKKGELDPGYLALLINSDYGKKFVVGGQAGGAQQNLNATTLKTFPVILPSLDEQAEIFDIVNSVSSKIVCIEKKYRSLVSAKKALMQDLLTGKVRVNVYKDEAAAALSA